METANFFAALQNAFRNASDKPFLRLPDERVVTYAEMDALSARMAGALLQTGARPDDRVVVQVDKSPENIALYLGALRAGLVYVPLNTAYTANELAYFLDDAAPAVFVCAPEKRSELSSLIDRAGIRKALTLGAKGEGSLMAAAKTATPTPSVEHRQTDDLAVILYTSGTTGRSKGAMLTHGNLISNARTLNTLWGFSAQDILLHALPVFHIHGLFVALHTAILSASEVLFLQKFDVAETRRQLRRATVMMGVPTFYTRLLADADFSAGDVGHMRLFTSGSAPLTIETFNEFKTRTGHTILERYGMSEAGMITSNPLYGERLAGTVGFALPGVSVRINAQNGPGEVEVKGPNIFAGYWRKDEKTRDAFTSDGWFKTGDLGELDAKGRLSLVGREKDLIIAGGFNIYPVEIEQVLDATPGILESAVIGAPHPDMGEGVVAVLVADGEQPELNSLEEAISSLAKFKRPRRFYWLDALPRNAMGKVQKQILRETFQRAFD